jgi:DNA-binding transcriptional regulator YiaG
LVNRTYKSIDIMEENKITPQELTEWLSRHGHTATWLARELGVAKATVSRWLNGHQAIPGPETALIRLLIRGELPFEVRVVQPDGALPFTREEWQRLEEMRFREGFNTAEEWVVAKIRAYLAMMPADNLPALSRTRMQPARTPSAALAAEQQAGSPDQAAAEPQAEATPAEPSPATATPAAQPSSESIPQGQPAAEPNANGNPHPPASSFLSGNI